MKTEMKVAGFALLGMPIFIILVVAVTGIYHAWVFWTIWNWFVPTVFLAVPALTIWQAWGLALVKESLFTRSPEKENWGAQQWITALLTPLIILGVGFLLKTFVL